MKMTKDQVMDRLVKNGITDEDLKKNYERGYAAAQRDLTNFWQRQIYGGCILALHNLYGFGTKRAMDVLNETKRLLLDLDNCADLLQEVHNKVGIEINCYSESDSNDAELFEVNGL